MFSITSIWMVFFSCFLYSKMYIESCIVFTAGGQQWAAWPPSCPGSSQSSPLGAVLSGCWLEGSCTRKYCHVSPQRWIRQSGSGETDWLRLHSPVYTDSSTLIIRPLQVLFLGASYFNQLESVSPKLWPPVVRILSSA